MSIRRKHFITAGEWLTFFGTLGFVVDALICLMAYGLGYDGHAAVYGRFSLFCLAWALVGVGTKRIAQDLF